MSMLGTLPVHAKKNWPEWVSTLTHMYNATMCYSTGFSPFFLMYGRTPILPIDVEFGVALPDISHASQQNYAEKLKARLKWAYKVAEENSDCEAARPKKYYDQNFKCMKIVPGGLVLVRVKAFGPDHKIVDRWEQVPTGYWNSITIHQCIEYNLSMMTEMIISVHYIETCCSLFSHFVMT